MCYPNNKLKEYPQKYKVNSRTDKDLCEKAFGGHKDFTPGIFYMGCACEYNITLGELKQDKYPDISFKNFFQVLN